MTVPDPQVCPRCHAARVGRMYLVAAKLDICRCAECGACWDQDPADRRLRRRVSRAIVDVTPHPRG